MNTRNRPKLDYKIFHEAGKNVCIEGEEIKFEMATAEEIAELKIKEDIIHTLKIYALDELLEGVEYVNDLWTKFRHIHFDLKNSLENYYEQYPDYENQYEKLVKFIKSSSTRLKQMKQEEEECNINNKIAAQGQERCGMYKAQLEVLTIRICQFDNLVDVNSVANIGFIDEYVKKMEGFLNECHTLVSKLKIYWGYDTDIVNGKAFFEENKGNGGKY